MKRVCKSMSGFLAGLVLLTMALALIPAAPAGAYEIVIRPDDAVVMPGDQDVPLTIYLRNVQDTIYALSIWFMLDRPDLAEFSGYDSSGTYCIEIDTTGTLMSGWDYIQKRSIGGTPHNAKIIGFADPPGSYDHEITPFEGEMPLIKILVDVYDIPPSMTDRAAVVMNMEILDHFGLSDRHGNSIGVITDTLVDTTCYNCLEYVGDECIAWEEIPGTTGDSCVYDSTLYAHLDTNYVSLPDGSLTVGICGDLTGDGAINILDITTLISYIYFDQDPYGYAVHFWDMNGDGTINILDITALISYIYMGGQPPEC